MRKNYSKKYLLLCAFLMMSVMAFAQTGSIKGKVVDETNQPLPGAAVSIDGTTSGGSTDVNGNYTISGLKPGTFTVTAKFLGYIALKKTVTVGNSVVTVDFDLKPQNTSLNEVVVIGYGTTKSKDVTGAVAVVSSKDFNQGFITTPEQLIQGKVAGVSVTSNSGAPGSGSTITIRGGASIYGGNDPLYVIDGVPLAPDGIPGAANAMDMINPNDIESFSILKDASAAAIYGNRASNGVILITTKKGQAGKPVINFSTDFSVAKLPKQAPVLSAQQFRDYVNTYGDAAQKAQLGTANTNWQNEIYQTALSTNNNLSVSGSAGKVPYRVSVGYTDQNGIVKTTSLERFTGAINLTPSLLQDHLKLNFNFKGSSVDQRFVNEGQIIGSATSFNPTVPVTSSNALFAPYGGYWQWTDPSAVNGLKQLAPLNPVGLLNQTHNTSQVYRAITSLAVDYKLHFFPDLHVNLNGSYDASRGFGDTRIPPNAASNYESVSQNGTLYSGSFTPYNGHEENKLFEGFLSYSKDMKNIKSHVDAVAGYAIQDFTNTQSNGLFDVNGLYYASTFSNAYTFNNGIVNLSSAKNYNNYQYLINENILTSFYGRVNYNYDQKYYLTASVRSDESTKFAPSTRTGVFPAAALAWRMSNEDFLKGNSVISNLKLRLEYGVTGNQEGIGDYDYLSQYSLSNSTAQYGFGSTYYQLYRPGAFYPGRTWETTHSSNIGVDYGFLNDRITGSIDYYYNTTKNLMAQITQAAGTNFSNSIVGNAGNMENKGLELSVTGKIIDKKDMSWTANFNVSFLNNKITNLTVLTNPAFLGLKVGGISGGTGNTISINQPGYARNTFLVYQQVYGSNGKPLDGVYVDRNGDGTINNQDQYQDHSPDPKQIYGMSSDFNYKSWNIGFVARANVGNYVYNNVAASTGIQRNILNPLGIINNGSSDVLASGLSGVGSNALLSDYYIQNGSFLRMDNIHLAYNFGQVFNGTGNLKMSFNVQNAFLITDYKGVDPELTYTGNGTQGASGGVDNNLYPRPRTFVIGLNLNLK
jgi:iron complex outermembrane receptor protein